MPNNFTPNFIVPVKSMSSKSSILLETVIVSLFSILSMLGLLENSVSTSTPNIVFNFKVSPSNIITLFGRFVINILFLLNIIPQARPQKIVDYFSYPRNF